MFFSLLFYGYFSSIPGEGVTYREVKQSMTQYQAAKERLMGHGAPFAGWIKTFPRSGSFGAGIYGTL